MLVTRIYSGDDGKSHFEELDLPLTVASRFPTDYGSIVGESDTSPPAPIVEGSSLLAQAAIGQYDVRATPLHMALVAGAVANQGEMMTPYLVARVSDSESGEVIDRHRTDVWRRALSPPVADVMRDMMVGVVERGTATSLARPGLVVGAKTGTAEVSDQSTSQDTHAWTIAFAGPDGADAQLAVEAVARLNR